MKIGCSFFYTDDRYKALAEISTQSFKTWHPDIDVFVFDKDHTDASVAYDYTAGYAKFFYARSLFDKGYDKVISLGVDTVTTGRLDEFINNNEDVLVTLDFNYGVDFNGFNLEADKCFNGDVVCFNNKKLLDDLLQIMREEAISFNLEQGTLAEILSIQPNIYSHKVIDKPEEESVYNCRVYYTDKEYRNNFAGPPHYPYPFKVENDKLISPLDKIIKVIHLVRGFGTFEKVQFIDEINGIKKNMFNQETKEYIINKCRVPGSWFETMMEDKDWPQDLNLFEGKTPAGFPVGAKIRVDNYNNLVDKFREKFTKKEEEINNETVVSSIKPTLEEWLAEADGKTIEWATQYIVDLKKSNSHDGYCTNNNSANCDLCMLNQTLNSYYVYCKQKGIVK